jgi:hypothetical protein
MAKRNGGIIGPSNVPTGQYGGTASGVWRLRDAFNYIKAGLWPVAGNYPVANSLRFNSGSTDYLQRTPASAGSLTTWTYSFWTKRSKLATAEQYLSAGPRSSPNVEDQLYSISTDAINWYDGTANANVLRTTQLFRDVSAWYHLMFVWDTTNATAGNRARIYVNGAEVTAFSIDNNPSLNAVSKFNGTGQHRIGQTATVSGENLDGYLAEVIFIDGQALTPSSFGLTDSATGIWIPKPYIGTYGTNGFYLNFANSADLGNDVSGNNNDWTVNNLTSVDQSTDTPTNNFATMNFLSSVSVTLTEGNLKGAGAGDENFRSTFAVNKGKWYWEVKLGADGGVWGICSENVTMATDRSGSAGVYGIQNAGGSFAYFRNNGSTGESAGFPNPVSGNIMNMAFDADNAKLYIGINGTFYNLSGSTGNPATGSNATYSSINTALLWLAFCEFRGAGQSCELNFGSPPFTISSGNADANGYGNFEYAVPSGYYALNTKNLAEYA